MTPVWPEPAALRSRVKHSTTEPLRSHHAELIGANKVAEMEMDKQNKLDDLKRHAKQQLDNILVRPEFFLLVDLL